MKVKQAKSELMQIYGALSPNKQIAIDTLIKASVNPQEPKYCDRNICVSNEYNGIGCDECEVTKSQEPKTWHWIPVSERLPEDETYVLTTIKVSNRVAHARRGLYQDGFFHNDNGDTWKATDKEIIAWMPLPKPYEQQESEV